MMTEEIRGTRILILGTGREGTSTDHWLRRHYPALHIESRDKDRDGEGYLSGLSAFDTVIRSPGVSPYLSEIRAYAEAGGHVTSATNIFFSRVSGMTVGITGTKGKSTTSSLIAHILSSYRSDVRLVGNIGYPMLDALDSSTPETVFVIELSSHQLADCRYSPRIAVILGIVAEHLDYYPDISTYARAKANITAFQSTRDWVIYNPEHTIVREIADTAKSRRVTYRRLKATGTHTGIADGIISVMHGESPVPVMNLSHVPLIGNVENVLAAVTVADIIGVPPATIAESVGPFKSLPHRLEFAGEFRGIRFYNDSLATIPEATIHALESLGSDVCTLIAGGYDRHLDFTSLGAYLRAHPVPTLILFPDTGRRILEAIGPLTQGAMITPYPVRTMEEAVRLAYGHTPAGKICLLSPASASYNLFRNYEDRGNQFKEWVRTFGSE